MDQPWSAPEYTKSNSACVKVRCGFDHPNLTSPTFFETLNSGKRVGEWSQDAGNGRHFIETKWFLHIVLKGIQPPKIF